MNEIVLTQDNVFLYDGGVPVRIVTSGIKLGRFNDNPIMLFNHDVNQVIGSWSNVKVSAGRIVATPNFDNDDFSKDIAGKYEKGTLKTASVGIDMLDAYVDNDDTIVVTSSEIYEASIASVPQNPQALTLSKNKPIKLTLSKGDNEVSKDILKRLELMKEEATVDVTTEEDKGTPENVESSSTPEVEEQTTEEVQSTPEVEEPLQAELQEENSSLKEQVDSYKAELDDLRAEIESLKGNVEAGEKVAENAKNDLESARSEVGELKLKIDEYETREKAVLLDEGLKLGKLTKEGAKLLLSKGTGEIKEILGAIPTNTEVSLANTLLLGRGSKEKADDKSYSWYLQNDKAGLIKLEKENPELIKQMQEDFLK